MQDKFDFVQEIKADAKAEAERKAMLGDATLPGDLRINNITLNIPPESISIIKTEYEQSNFMIREPIPSTMKTGKKKTLVHVPMVFDLGSTGSDYSQIAQLMIQVRKCPLVTVENEKIRSEILGPGIDQSLVMGFIVESISGSIDGEFPTLLRCDLQMSWFNHIPYTKEILYRGNTAEGVQEPVRSVHPTSLFEEFYEHGTIKNGSLINDPTAAGLTNADTVELFYKEYKTFPGSLNVKNPPGKTSQFEKKIKARNDTVDQQLHNEGWINASSRMGFPEQDDVYYRWVRFEIPTVALGESGPLILESLGFTLNTNIAYIPLQSYSTPTAQFMGGSMATIRGIVFAGAEVDASNYPIGTSRKLAELQKILDHTAENRFKFDKYAKEDFVLIRHPISKLMKYRPYTEERFYQKGYVPSPNSISLTQDQISPVDGGQHHAIDNLYVDIDNPRAGAQRFDYDDMLPVVVSNRISATVEGHPFASRFQFEAKETRLKNDNDSISIAGGGTGATKGTGLARNTMKESWLGLAKQLASAYKISKVTANNRSYFEVTSPDRNPDREDALELAKAMTNMLNVVPDAQDINDLMKSPLFARHDSDLSTMIIKARLKSGAAFRISRPTDGTKFLNTSTTALIISNVLKKAAEEEWQGWAAKYSEGGKIITSLHSIPASQTYADLMLPPTRTSPSYYFCDFEDEVMNRIGAINVMTNEMIRVDDNLIKAFHSKDAYKAIGIDITPSSGGVGTSANLATINKNEKASAVHAAADPKHRAFLAIQALSMSTSTTNSLSQAFPTFKIYLKQDNIFFERELSTADRSDEEQKNLLNTFRDFSEFFDVQNVVDIRLVKDQDIAADLLVLRIVSTDRDKVNKIRQDIDQDTDEHNYLHRKIIDKLEGSKKEPGTKLTRDEEEFKKYGLQEGTRIQARLGYSTDPNLLPVEFNGRIVSVRGRDVIEVICLGNGEELVKEVKAASIKDKYSFNSNTPDLIEKLLENSPEVVSFGNLNYKMDMGFENALMPAFFGGRTVLDNIFAPNLFDSYTAIKALSSIIENGSLLFSIGTASLPAIVWLGTTFSISLLAGATALPVLGVAAGAAILYESYSIADRWINGSPFTVYNNTLWDVFQELTLRHPGVICSVVPYDNRSTIFFGEPHEHYFYRGPTPLEAGFLPRNTFFNKTTREMLDKDVLKLSGTTFNPQSDVSGFERQTELNRALTQSKKKPLVSDVVKNRAPTRDQAIFSMLKPYRNYHMVSSEHDIIANTIEVTSRDVANAIQIAFPVDSDDGNFDGSVGFSGYELSNVIQADDDLYNEYIKKKVLTFHNANKDNVDDMPERYAKAVLCKELERIYRGKLVILGRPNIKPHDVVIMRDVVNDIMGPIGVAKVTHIMSPHQGWVTEITPKLMVFPDNASGAFQLQAVMIGASAWLTDEAERFYTNIRRYMPDEGPRTVGSDIVELIRYFNGSDLEEYEQLNFSSKESLNVMNTGSAWLNDPNKDNNLYNAAIAGSAIAAGFAGEAVQAGLNKIDATGKLLVATRNSAAGTLAGLGTVVDDVVTGTAGGAFSVTETTTTAVKTGFTAGSTVTKGALVVGSKIAGPLVHLALAAFVNRIVSWTKYRQPVMIYPLTREGTAWYAGLNGFRDNTMMQHFELEAERIGNKFEFYQKYAKAAFSAFWSK